jgi:hypothetical protein
MMIFEKSRFITMRKASTTTNKKHYYHVESKRVQQFLQHNLVVTAQRCAHSQMLHLAFCLV